MTMQNPSTRKRIFGIESDSRSVTVILIVTLILLAAAAVIAAIAIDAQARP